jgi:hypothetical protein
VSNTESRNRERFEANLKGKAVESRISRLLPGPDRDSFDLRVHNLNSPLDRGPEELPADELRALGLSQPTDLVFSADGSRAWAAVFGSNKVVELDSRASVQTRIEVGAGPAGLALDETRNRLFVLNHLGASLSVIDLTSLAVRDYPLAFDPRPETIKAGQPFLYDASISSANGTQSCASCHVFGDLDGMAWDLGVPGAEIDRMPFELTHENFVLKPRDFWFHPEKGPMMTQSFRGMSGTGPLHWRGDRFATDEEPEGEVGNFARFAPAFEGLLGRDEALELDDMESFARFVFTIRYPPNPLQRLDRQLTPSESAGAALFAGEFAIDSGVTNCEGCHSLPLGTNGLINFEGDRSGQDFKAPHLRNLYEKVGRLDHKGPVISGFSFGHDGSVDTLLEILETELFAFPGDTDVELSQSERLSVVAYLMAFDTGMAPAVGRQISLEGAPSFEEKSLIDTLVERATVGDCDLIAKANKDGSELGWLWQSDQFAADLRVSPGQSLTELLRLASPQMPLTLLCVPPGDGQRSALDRDMDGFWNGEEREAGSNPADRTSRPDALFTHHIILPRLIK